MKGIEKQFPGVRALQGVDFSLMPGEVCAILGENGAGKSTLMNVLGGVYPFDSGSICLDGNVVKIRGTKDAEQLGISFIHQELSLFPLMDIASNIYIQDLPANKGILRTKKMYQDTKEILKRVKLEHCRPDQLVGELKIGEQQLVEIGRTLTRGIKILILDEPTSSLTSSEVEVLFQIVRELKAQGTAIVFITHHMDEIYEICDTLMIMRDGQRIIKCNVHDITRAEVVNTMLGHSAEEQYEHPARSYGEEVLTVKGLTRKGKLNNINFRVRKGEMVGLYGLLGSGRTEVLRSIFGLDKFDSGEICYLGKKMDIRSPRDAIRYGIGMVTEDRHLEGLLLDESVKFNMTLADLKSIQARLFISPRKEAEISRKGVEDLRVKTPSIKRAVKYLSGGNQQKVVLAKWLNTNPSLLLLDEPTRGIDIGAKQEIYSIVESLLEKGVAVIMVSSEVPEVLGVCDRVVVLQNGNQVCDLVNDETLSASTLLEAAMGGAEL
ncbi:MAG: sugar ABC transporter ATP-binding protein [Eubacteriales bacterium]|nr:sugar ABC transporter ATP-binding protein [Eubacteriales bacterium]